jgi:uncharacterized protein
VACHRQAQASHAGSQKRLRQPQRAVHDGDELGCARRRPAGWLGLVVPGQADSPASYGLVQREVNSDGVGIGGAVSEVPDEPSPTWRGQRRDEGYPGHVTVYVEVPDVEAALVQAEEMGGTRLQGPDTLMPSVQTGRFTDPEGHLIGIVTASR